MAAFCIRTSSDIDNLCSLSPTEEVENPSIKHEPCRRDVGEIIQPKGWGCQTVLHRCATVGNSRTMAALIAGGCALDLQDQDGNTALHEASWHGFSQCVKLLIRAGAGVHVKNKAGNTALHLACQNGHSQTAQLLLVRGSNPDTKNKMGDTCAHLAARYNNLSLMKILLRSECSMSETNQAGDTALHVAAALNHKKIVQLLLAAGNNRRVQNQSGHTSKAEKTALDKTRAKRNKRTAHLFTKAPQVCYLRRTRKHRARALPTKVSCSLEETTKQTESRSASRGLTEEDLTKRKNRLRLQKICDEDEARKVLQLYTLYRDKEGKVRQAPASCPCDLQLQKLEHQLKASEEEVRLHVLNVQQEVSRRLDRMERRTQHQLRVLDLLNQEMRSMVLRVEQEAAGDRAQDLRTQAAERHELETWCLSLLEDRDRHGPAQTRRHKLLLEPSAAEPDPSSAHSNTSFPTNNLSSRCAARMRSRKYFEMEDRSSDQNQNPTSPAERPSGLLQISAAPSWQPAALQDVMGSEGYDEPLYPQQEHRKATEGKTIPEFFTDQPAEPTLNRERNHLRAMEATQRFFDVVTSQLERWCCRRILEVERQAELRARTDRKELLQRITELEEELHRARGGAS